MRKLYSLVLIALLSVSGRIYAMGQSIPEGKQEIEEFEENILNVLPAELLQKIALSVASAATLKQAYKNVISFLISLGTQGRTILEDDTFVKYLVDILYDQFITSSTVTERLEAVDNALELSVSLKNNAYPSERFERLLASLYNDRQYTQQDYLNYFMFGLFQKKLDKKISSVDLLNRLDFFIKRGADINAIEKRQGFTPLAAAAFLDEKFIVEYLLEQGADINKVAYFRDTPLMIATRQGHTDMVAYLIHNGADLNAINADKETAHDIASRSGYGAIIAIIDEAAASCCAIC